MDLFVKIKQRHPVCDTPFIIKFYSPVKWHAFNSMLIPRAITIKQAVKTSRQIGWRKSSGGIRTWERIIHQFNHITLRSYYYFSGPPGPQGKRGKKGKKGDNGEPGAAVSFNWKLFFQLLIAPTIGFKYIKIYFGKILNYFNVQRRFLF